MLLRAIQILAGVEGLVEERNTVLLRAIQNTGRGGGEWGLGGERTTVLLHAIQNTFIIYISVGACVWVQLVNCEILL